MCGGGRGMGVGGLLLTSMTPGRPTFGRSVSMTFSIAGPFSRSF